MLANIVLQFFLKGGPSCGRSSSAPSSPSPSSANAPSGGGVKARSATRKKWSNCWPRWKIPTCPPPQKIAEGSEDPVIRMIHRGLAHVGHAHASLLGALQLAAGIELKRAGRFLTVMDTLVTLAPLLGLLGTVTGLMRAFLNIGSAELSVTGVTGGIGEALIATACGLGIAIFSLIPFNFFSAKVTQLQFELETAATNVEVMVGGGVKSGDTAHLTRTTPPSRTTSH